MAGRNRGRGWRAAGRALVVAGALSGLTGTPGADAQQVEVPPGVVDVPPVPPPVTDTTGTTVTTPPLPAPTQTVVNLPLPGAPVTVVLPPLPVALPELSPVLRTRPGRPPRPQRVAPAPTAPRVGIPLADEAGATAAPPQTSPRRVPDLDAVPVAPTGRPVRRSAAAPVPTLATSDAARAVKQFTFPLGMTGIVVLFLLVQALVDRRDPKLAAAPVIDELYMFR